MSRKYISQKKRNRLRELSKERCEYCKFIEKYSPQSFVVEHIYPLSLGGNDNLENLAYSCGGCNLHKSNKISGVDIITNNSVKFFNPRRDDWDTHFEWDGDCLNIIGKTTVGRVTIRILKMNRTNVVNHRTLTILSGEHPAK